jgi:ubiquinone/menaquinone biosynthesis C-methylase UbiE
MASERQLDTIKSPWWGEHLNRYEEAVKLFPSNNLKILDLACGSGFGTNYLARLGNTVTGGDISEETIRACKKKYLDNNITFEKVDGTRLPYQSNYFDVVISFETIEHTTQYQIMLDEFKRVVKKEGLIILSTPNFMINSPSGKVTNPYHTQEWVYEELDEILKKTFSSSVILGQSYARYTNKHAINYKIAKVIESVFYKRVIRKLPLAFQDFVLKLFINESMYPSANNYILSNELETIKKCKTFFAVCKP